MNRILIVTDKINEPTSQGVFISCKNLVEKLSNKYDILIIHPRYMCYNDYTPLPVWKMYKDKMLNPWIYKTLIESCIYIDYHVHLASDGSLCKYTKKILKKKKTHYTTNYIMSLNSRKSYKWDVNNSTKSFLEILI